MPIYEYLCDNCDHHFEMLQKVNDEPTAQCPNCEQSQVKRLVSATSFRLKGSGWYETDFKNNKQDNSSASTTNKTNDTPSKSDDSSSSSDKSQTPATTVSDKKESKVD